MLFGSLRRFQRYITYGMIKAFRDFILIFKSKVEYQKVVRLSTWVIESNSSFDKMKDWLNRSGRMKFQDNTITG